MSDARSSPADANTATIAPPTTPGRRRRRSRFARALPLPPRSRPIRSATRSISAGKSRFEPCPTRPMAKVVLRVFEPPRGSYCFSRKAEDRSNAIVGAGGVYARRIDPSSYPELLPYPSLRRLVRWQVDMQFRDLRTLLQLPRRDVGLEGGCNFAAARLCFDLVAGASVLFYDSSAAALHERGTRGQRFKRLLATYYPWLSGFDAVVDEPAAELLYTMARNPLAHAFGVLGRDAANPEADRPTFFVSKEQLDATSVAEIEQARELPTWMDPTIRHAGENIYTLFVPTLAWGIHRMLQRLFGDEQQATRAELTARALLA